MIRIQTYFVVDAVDTVILVLVIVAGIAKSLRLKYAGTVVNDVNTNGSENNVFNENLRSQIFFVSCPAFFQ